MDLDDPYFGVIEVPNSTTSTVRAPGYAIVPDTGFDPSKVAIQPTGRKRAAATKAANANHAIGAGEITSRQQAAILKHLQELDKDDSRDVRIEVPKGQTGGASRAGKKTTTNVTRILKSEKTFAHHLADEEAFLAQHQIASLTNTVNASKSAPLKSSRSSLTKEQSHPSAQSASTDRLPTENNLQGHTSEPPPEEENPLLRIYAPTAPSKVVLDALISAPPLSYNQARAAPPTKRAQRHYCVICGYWGRVRCIKCGTRVCGIACKREHDAECAQIYAWES